MENIPSDFKLLTEIYKRYYEQYEKFSREDPDRESRMYVPINIEAISDHLKSNKYIIFGRLNLHLNKKYGYKNDNGSISPFFSRKVGRDENAINFPLLVSVISALQEERSKQNISIYLSIFAVTISLFTLALNGYKILYETKIEPPSCIRDCVKTNKFQPQNLEQQQQTPSQQNKN